MKKLITIFIYLLSPLICYGAEHISCAYPEKDSNVMVSSESCGEIDDDGLLSVKKQIIEKVNWNKYGIECAYIYGTKDKNGWYFINQSGKGRISPFWQDNDCAPFSEGLAIGLSHGKVVFYNHIFEIVKRSNYVYASIFHEGLSKVCRGDLKKEYDSQGEHYQYIGGSCGYVDRQFKEVVPLAYPFEKTPKPKKP